MKIPWQILHTTAINGPQVFSGTRSVQGSNASSQEALPVTVPSPVD